MDCLSGPLTAMLHDARDELTEDNGRRLAYAVPHALSASQRKELFRVTALEDLVLVEGAVRIWLYDGVTIGQLFTRHGCKMHMGEQISGGLIR